MAMNTNSGNTDSVMAEINVTPLVDVMLVLLVIFIITAPLIVPQSMKIALPKTQMVSQQDQAKNSQLTVTATGTLTFEGQTLTDAQLAQALREKAAEPKFQLQIYADEKVPYGRVAELMALAQANGVTRLLFVTLPK